MPEEVLRAAFKDHKVSFKARSRSVMRHIFEIFMTCQGDWMRSSLVYSYRQSSVSKRVGAFVWVTLKDLKAEYLGYNNLYIYSGKHLHIIIFI